jgi:hypothetical protein
MDNQVRIDELEYILSKEMDYKELSVRIRNILQFYFELKYHTIGDLIFTKKAVIKSLRGMGTKNFKELEDFLKDWNICFYEDYNYWEQQLISKAYELSIENDPDSVIRKLKLTDRQVWLVVKEWYTRGMCPDILQDQDGRDLEEICEIELY